MEINDYEKYNTKVTSVTIPYNLWLKAKQNLISFADAINFGIAFKLAEKGLMEYPINSLINEIDHLQENIIRLQKKITEFNTPKEELNIDQQIEKELKEVLGDENNRVG